MPKTHNMKVFKTKEEAAAAGPVEIFKVEVQVTLIKVVEVEALNETVAIHKVKKAYNAARITLDDSDCQDVQFVVTDSTLEAKQKIE